MKEKKSFDLNNDSLIISNISNDKEVLNLNINLDQEEEKAKIKIVPFKKYFLKIYKDKDKSYYYILDRLKYDINTIMMLLDLNKINHLSEII